MTTPRKKSKKSVVNPTVARRIETGGPSARGDSSLGDPVAKRSQGRPRAAENIGQYGYHSLLWTYFANWLTKSRPSPKGLPSRAKLWDAVPNQKVYFIRLALLAFCDPRRGAAPEFLNYVYQTSPELTCEALLYLRVHARTLKANGSDRHVVFKGFSNEKLSLSDRNILRRMRKGHAGFVAGTRA